MSTRKLSNEVLFLPWFIVATGNLHNLPDACTSYFAKNSTWEHVLLNP